MSLRRYAVLLRTRPIGYLMTTSVVARLPSGMTSLAIVLIVTRTGSYTRAGAVASAFVAGAALAGPLMGRAVDRFGRYRVLRPAALAQAALIGTLASLDQPLAMAACALCAGLASPPIISSTRSLWGQILPPDLRAGVFALEATMAELPFTVGPSLVALLTAVSSPRVALVTSGVFMAVGVLAFTAHPATRLPPVRRTAAVTGHRPPVPATMLAVAGLVIAAFAVFELSTVAFTSAHRAAAAAGVELTVWSLGSMAGGLLWGTRAARSIRPVGRLAALTAALSVGTALPALATGLVPLGALVFLAGVVIAPTFGALYALVAAAAPAGRQTEAFGWLSSAFLIGGAAGSAAGGAAVQVLGPRSGYLVAAAVIGVACGLLVVRASGTEPAADSPAAEGPEPTLAAGAPGEIARLP
ncbi:MAG TPA: MFS transporter [Mycobacteriales bacterium]|nr:MFS transporter [Mycobacteriales bacterium]